MEMTIGEALKRLRQSKGMTQDQIAGSTGKNRSVVVRSETEDANPTWNTINKYLGATGSNLWDLAAILEPYAGLGRRGVAAGEHEVLAQILLSLRSNADRFAADLREAERDLRSVTGTSVDQDPSGS